MTKVILTGSSGMVGSADLSALIAALRVNGITFALHGASGASPQGRSWTRALNIKGRAELLPLDRALVAP